MADTAAIDMVAAAGKAGVRIRAREPEDLLSVAAMMSEPGVLHGTLHLPFSSISDRAARYAEATGPHVHALVAETVTETSVVGSLTINRSARPSGVHSASLGMGVADAHQGRGIGTALLAAGVDLCDRWLQIRRLELDVFTDNAPALALYRRFGFEVEGTKRQAAFRDGAYIDCYCMARIRG